MEKDICDAPLALRGLFRLKCLAQCPPHLCHPFDDSVIQIDILIFGEQQD